MKYRSLRQFFSFAVKLTLLFLLVVCAISKPQLQTPRTSATEVDFNSLPVVSRSSLQYLGAFRLPQNCLPGPISCDSFSFAGREATGRGIAYNPANNSLFIATYLRNVAEIGIPTSFPSTASDLSQLPIAPLLQTATDPTEGTRNNIDNSGGPNGDAGFPIGGLFLTEDNKLLVNYYRYYDAGAIQLRSMFRRPANLSDVGHSEGPFKVGDTYPGHVAGYMFSIPQEWRSALGGSIATGLFGTSITFRTSQGPAAWVFDSANLTSTGTSPARGLIDYPYTDDFSKSLDPVGSKFNFGEYSEYSNWSTFPGGAFFPTGTKSVVFFTTHGIGPMCYGFGAKEFTDYQGIHHVLPPNLYNFDNHDVPKLGSNGEWQGLSRCYNPYLVPNTFGDKGPTAFPYIYQVLVYDANDMLAVKNGTKQPWQVKPTGRWPINFGIDAGIVRQISGVAYDSINQKVYIAENTGSEYNGAYAPIIHVFKLNISAGTSSSDKTPPTISISSPNSLSTISGNVNLTAAATDNTGVVGVQFQIDGNDFGSEDTSVPFNVSLNSALFSNGVHILTTFARDGAENTASSIPTFITIANSTNPTPDLTPPVVNISDPSNGSTVTGSSVNIVATASDNIGVAKVQFKLDGSNLGAEDISSPYLFTFNSTLYSNGLHTLSATAYDVAGNLASSATVNITINNAINSSVPDKIRANSYDDTWQIGWVNKAKQVINTPVTGIAKTTGKVLELGDSMTYSMAYGNWANGGLGKTAEDNDAIIKMYGNQNNNKNGWYLSGAGITAASGAGWELVDSVLNNINATDAQMAVLMFNTPDSNPTNLSVIQTKVNALLAKGILPILSTIPPRTAINYDATIGDPYNAALRTFAQQNNLPLIDYAKEILLRRPNGTWANTLIGSDGVHPSGGVNGFNPGSDPYASGGNPLTHTTGEATLNSGYLLRTWLTVQKMKEIQEAVGINGSTIPITTTNPATLIGSWNFDEGSGIITTDNSGRNNSLSISGPTWTTGKSGTALSFNGNSSLQITNLPIKEGTGESNSVAFWMKWDGTQNVMPFGWGGLYDLFIYNNCFGINTGEGNVLGISTNGLANNWNHITVVFPNAVPNTSNVKLYMNGVEQIVGNCVGQAMVSMTATANAQLSGWSYSSSYKFTGLIDDLKIYSGEVNANQVQVLAGAIQTNTTPTGSFDEIRLSDGVIRGWTLDPDTKTSSNQVHIYIDVAAGAGGTLLTGSPTDILRSDVNAAQSTSGNHGFQYIIPTQYRNGVSHNVYVYGIDTSNTAIATLLSGSPKSFTLSTPVTPPITPPVTPPVTPPTTPPVTPTPTPSVTPPSTPTITFDSYPQGTIFKHENNPTVFIKEGSTARPITDWTVYLNNVPTTRPIVTIPNDVSFNQGSNLSLRNGTLIKAEDNPTIYLVVNGTKRPFINEPEFLSNHYSYNQVYIIKDTNLVNNLPTTNEPFVRPVGTWFKYSDNPTIYYLNSWRQKRPFTTWNMYRLWVDDPTHVVTLDTTEVYPDGPIVTFPNGILIKGSGTTIYLVDNNTKRPFTNQEKFNSLGYQDSDVIPVEDNDLSLIPMGSEL